MLSESRSVACFLCAGQVKTAMNEFENLYFDFLCAALFICFTCSTIVEWEYVRVISWLSLMKDGLMKLYAVYKKQITGWAALYLLLLYLAC